MQNLRKIIKILGCLTVNAWEGLKVKMKVLPGVLQSGLKALKLRKGDLELFPQIKNVFERSYRLASENTDPPELFPRGL